MRTLTGRFVSDESGATAIEYSLIAALIGLAIMVGASSLGNEISNLFNYVGNKTNSATNNI
jgi:pilus assembly protein Flp/PilA